MLATATVHNGAESACEITRLLAERWIGPIKSGMLKANQDHFSEGGSHKLKFKTNLDDCWPESETMQEMEDQGTKNKEKKKADILERAGHRKKRGKPYNSYTNLSSRVFCLHNNSAQNSSPLRTQTRKQTARLTTTKAMIT